MTKAFTDKHSNEKIEFAVIVDKNGYATKYLKGSGGSVSFSNAEDFNGNHIVHNHPADGWGNFSGADLETWAKTGATGISAVSRNKLTPVDADPRVYANRRAGLYQVTKTHAFKTSEFMRALQGVTASSANYDSDMHQWLKDNQKKYGYRYTYRRARNKAD